MQLFKKLGAVAVALVMATATILPMVSVDASALTDEGITGTDLAAIENEEFDYCYDVQRSITTDSGTNETTIESWGPADPYVYGAVQTSPNTSGVTWSLTKVSTYGEYKDNTATPKQDLTNVISIVKNYYGDKLSASNMDENNIIIHELKKGADRITLGVIIAYGPNLNNTTDNNTYINFIGNNNNGYLLSDVEFNANNRLDTKLSANMVATAEYTPSSNNNSNTGNTGATTQPTTPTETPADPAEPAKDKTPNTGDESNAAAWMAILMLSGAALAGLGVNRKFNVN